MKRRRTEMDMMRRLDIILYQVCCFLGVETVAENKSIIDPIMVKR